MKIHDPQDIKISRKKSTFPISENLEKYLVMYDRYYHANIHYSDLLDFQDAIPVYDVYGNDTFWKSVIYPPHLMEQIHDGLKHIYAWLKSDGSFASTSNLVIDSIDFCTFGNSNPFRIKIKNLYNDNHDYFYIKKADASRVYGLELEHILSPNHINYLIYKDTIVEEHIIGIPGDVFLGNYFNENLNKIRFAKEFVKFNERCFMRLLGDQRAYNFVVVLTPDFDKVQYRIRSIDFDQQSYEGNINMYKPQFFKENYSFVKLVLDVLDEKSIIQYQTEERALLAKRMIGEEHRLNDLMRIMQQEKISHADKVENLKNEVYNFVKDKKFKTASTMGEIVKIGLDFVLRNYKNAVLTR
ncbi:MAG: hypothetical protein H6604_09055 [Flavobacteriales bacterium]|nr:hypothetical protein [Flavobacteriales bacterium]